MPRRDFLKRLRRGAALVELAIALPLLLIFLAVMLEGGRLFYTYFRLSGAAFEGARFCASLLSPVTQCFDFRGGPPPYTTNLSLWGAAAPSDPEDKAIFEFHKLIHDRVAAIFYINPKGWSITSDELIPDGTGRKVNEVSGRENFPTIKSQYIGVYNSAETLARCPAPVPTAEEENTCTVCLSATYVGHFFNIPISACSVSFVLVNNEQMEIP
ncbi:MAG: pilus assembly protein, partial [Deltaproteobacteria bacterium]|nr:pilus assembly protein [Deltaproteobacteria bacterium]